MLFSGLHSREWLPCSCLGMDLWDPKNTKYTKHFPQEFSAVVFAGTASDAGNLEGLRSALSPEQLRALNAVRYDHRMCVALSLGADSAVSVNWGSLL